MVKAIERFLVVAPRNGRGCAFGGTVQETMPDGRIVEGPLTEIPKETLSEWVSDLNTDLLEENIALRTQNDQLKADISTKTQELSTLTTSRDSLQSQLTQANEASAAKDATIAEHASTIAALQARVASLLDGLPWNPRIMEASAFLNRITVEEVLKLGTSSDLQVLGILALLNQYKENDWPVVLDSPGLQQAIGYLGAIGMVEPQRVAELLRDCTRDEAHIADGSQ